MNDCNIPGLTDFNNALGSTAMDWASLGLDAGATTAQGLGLAYKAGGALLEAQGMVGALSGSSSANRLFAR